MSSNMCDNLIIHFQDVYQFVPLTQVSQTLGHSAGRQQ